MGTLTNKLAVYALAVALCMGAGGFLVYRSMSAHVTELKGQLRVATASLDATNAALETKTKALRTLAQSYTKKEKELAHALKDNPDWAAGRVPDAVFNSVFPDPATAP